MLIRWNSIKSSACNVDITALETITANHKLVKICFIYINILKKIFTSFNINQLWSYYIFCFHKMIEFLLCCRYALITYVRIYTYILYRKISLIFFYSAFISFLNGWPKRKETFKNFFLLKKHTCLHPSWKSFAYSTIFFCSAKYCPRK